jgi:hypothetical protein
MHRGAPLPHVPRFGTAVHLLLTHRPLSVTARTGVVPPQGSTAGHNMRMRRWWSVSWGSVSPSSWHRLVGRACRLARGCTATTASGGTSPAPRSRLVRPQASLGWICRAPTAVSRPCAKGWMGLHPPVSSGRPRCTLRIKTVRRGRRHRQPPARPRAAGHAGHARRPGGGGALGGCVAARDSTSSPRTGTSGPWRAAPQRAPGGGCPTCRCWGRRPSRSRTTAGGRRPLTTPRRRPPP